MLTVFKFVELIHFDYVNSKTDNQYFQVTLLLQIWVIFFFLKSWSLLMCSKIWFFFSHHKSHRTRRGCADCVFTRLSFFIYRVFFSSRTLSKISLFHLTVVFKTQEYSPLSLCIHKNEGKRVGQINQTCFSNPYPYLWSTLNDRNSWAFVVFLLSSHLLFGVV